MSSPTSSAFETVAPVRPAAGYIGGKRNLARRITAIIEQTPHTGYAEPFVGMGGIFLRRLSRPRTEVINDWSQDVANFFRICQRHYVAFIDMLRFQLATRTRFEELQRTDPTTLTDLERAARFLDLQRAAFGGKVAGRNFGVVRNGPARFDVSKLGPVLEAIHERLTPVIIERLPWADFMRRWDRPGMLFYCDPPYFGSEDDYGADDAGTPLFDRTQFEQLAEVAAGLKGKVMISLNDRPEVRRIFRGFELCELETTYTLASGSNARRAGELLIVNR
ncbi:DNA adenine methylase [Novosphingopyxis sp. YJ-S2-01]|uniref:DNA adenine methylase n=1 Tax=Novosphingopyxis sp. YJ-S2-01 TaxID=2794021 RepID=UPI0018DD4D3F|nr:DNA adenine methylase [Novosphingopyxis sp. YJ-S2-01]MBH9536945.1 DNA adenine methylase [Novosphingopyxis sp. YJ-S2-01]